MAICTDYPLAMYRAVEDYQRAENAEQEQALREEGYLSGHEFFSRLNNQEVQPEPTPEPKRKGKRGQ